MCRCEASVESNPRAVLNSKDLIDHHRHGKRKREDWRQATSNMRMLFRGIGAFVGWWRHKQRTTLSFERKIVVAAKNRATKLMCGPKKTMNVGDDREGEASRTIHLSQIHTQRLRNGRKAEVGSTWKEDDEVGKRPPNIWERWLAGGQRGISPLSEVFQSCQPMLNDFWDSRFRLLIL